MMPIIRDKRTTETKKIFGALQVGEVFETEYDHKLYMKTVTITGPHGTNANFFNTVCINDGKLIMVRDDEPVTLLKAVIDIYSATATPEGISDA